MAYDKLIKETNMKNGIEGNISVFMRERVEGKEDGAKVIANVIAGSLDRNYKGQNTLHSVTLHGIHCSQSRSIGPRCMESTAFNRDPFSHASWNTLRSIGRHFTMLHVIHCIQ